jgi:hypothetical protein
MIVQNVHQMYEVYQHHHLNRLFVHPDLLLYLPIVHLFQMPNEKEMQGNFRSYIFITLRTTVLKQSPSKANFCL